MIKDFFQFSMETFRQRKVRTLLTMLGIFVGIAAIVALISLGQGFEKKITEQFNKLGADKLFITPKAPFAPPGSSTLGVELTEDDLDFVKRQRGVDDTTSFVMTPAKVEFKDEVRFFNVIGVPVDGMKLWKELAGDFDIEIGRQIKEGDKFKIVIGHNYLDQNLFKKNVKLRDSLIISDIDFKVVGVWEFIGSAEDDRSITMPIETAREVFDVGERLDGIIVRTVVGADPAAVGDLLKKKLRKHRGLEEGKEDFRVQSFDEVLRSFNQVLGTVQVVLVAIAMISLIVGGIGIMNTMYTSVVERTSEIGIMKAIGARNSDIAKIYLIESGLLGLAGGIVGIVLGMSISKSIELLVRKVLLFEFIEIFFPWYMILGVALFAFIIGAVSGVLPAIHAANLEPVDALRYE